MKVIENWFRASDGHRVFFHEFLPDDNKVEYVLQIVHGMAEHSLRYEEFARFLTDRGIAVYINDHRGHGRTAYSTDDMGVWNYKNAWSVIVDDIKNLNDNIALKIQPGKDIYLLGHSMGSFLTMSFLTKYSSSVKGAILIGPGYIPAYKICPYRFISKLQCLIFGYKYKSKLFHNLIFGSYHKFFDKPFEWLSTNREVVDKYVKDPFCGGKLSSSFYNSLFKGLIYNNNIYNIRKISKDLPVLLLAGTDDPVGNFGKSVEIVVKRFKEAGIKDVEHKLYEGARHEVLNEINNTKIFHDIFMWINLKREIKNVK